MLSCGVLVSELILIKGELCVRNVNIVLLCKLEVILDSRMYVVKGWGNVYFLDFNNKINLIMCFICLS